MDLIYMNADKEDIGVLHNYEMDLAFGEDENNFECTMSAKNHCCEAGYYLYIEGTEYGGIIDGIKSETGSEDVIYSGRTWHGILGSKIILPLQNGESSTDDVTIRLTDSSMNSLVNRYLIVSGDANACLRFVIDRIGVSDMFEVPGNLAGVNINSYQFNRYTDAYMGIRKMLASAGLKMKLAYSNGKVVVSAVERYDFSKDDSFDSDLLDLSITKKYKTVNHLICLGKGELENRLVIHLYADAEGNISQEQTQFGLDEYAATYDYSTVESEEELLAKGKEELKALWSQDELSMDFDESMDAYDVGDIVGGLDNVTGVAVASTITKKVVTINNGRISIALSTDDVSSSGSGSTGNGSSNDSEALDEETIASLKLLMWPVGSIYTSRHSTSPAVLFGGTWERIKDTFILAAGDTYVAGSEGGESEHLLTEEELPAIYGSFRSYDVYNLDNTDAALHITGVFSYDESESYGTTTNMSSGKSDTVRKIHMNIGGDKPHNNMPPYLVVYVWERIA